jgi:uncharacterized protein with von Willebrand factor type A (vWA) domain
VTKPDTGDVIDVLLAQHGLIQEVFGQVHDAAPDERAKPFDDLVYLLEAHATGERRTIHAALREQLTARETADARIAEEDEIEAALGALKSLGVDGDGFDDGFDRLHLAVLTHTANEERDEFPLLRRHIEADRLRAMAGELTAIQDQL